MTCRALLLWAMLQSFSALPDECSYDCFSGDGQVNRTALTFSQLQSEAQGQPVNYSHYAIPANAANPENTFSGTLNLTITPGVLSEHGTRLAGSYTNPDSLPPFSYQFIQTGTHLIPLERQVITTGHPSWDYILLPGRVWQEAGDQGFSRVALPFALQEVNANCIHNGVMTFLFKNDGSVSRVAYQIAQETCQYFKFNLHGKLAAGYQQQRISNAALITQQYLQEMARRIVQKPLADLASDHSTADLNIAAIGADQSSGHLSAYGVYYQGVHYQGNCSSRQGNYPYCNVMALPSYSTAKTVVAGFALMRLEQKFAGSAKALSISDYVSQCPASHWADVSFGQTLDMATGNFDSAADSADEGTSNTINEFFLKASHTDKIQHSCSYPRKAPPGSLFVYHSSDTYVLSAALQQYYRQQVGPQADYYQDLLVAELWKPLHLSPLSYQSRRSLDSAAVPWAGFGLSLLSDDLLKLGRFAAIDQGKVGTEQLLNLPMLQDALQQGSNGGLTTGTAGSRYRYGFWAYDLSASSQLNCQKPGWVPYMSGFGGIGVVMLPNDMLYYYVSDNNEYGFIQTVHELAKISPVCQ